jgi:hypothetical protein
MSPAGELDRSIGGTAGADRPRILRTYSMWHHLGQPLMKSKARAYAETGSGTQCDTALSVDGDAPAVAGTVAGWFEHRAAGRYERITAATTITSAVGV